ncbi:MAG TPA: hypothetical protein VJN64_14030 [Terriglobales bacterium]|nr:hypothetical protein [Terriglobales bacterium]
MIRALLDHPWSVENVLEPESVLKRFNDWIRSHQLVEPVAFIDEERYELLKQQAAHTHANARMIFTILPSYVARRSDAALAEPLHWPNDLPDSWKRALREALGDLVDWRNPQIVTFACRRDAWPNTDQLQIVIAEKERPEQRVFAILEDYEQHRYAMSDFDPWDLERCHLPPNPNRLNQFRCRLPKHPELEGLTFDKLQKRITELQKNGWRFRIGGLDRYYFFPREDWNLAEIKREDWRDACKTFPRDSAAQNKGSGPVDYWNRVWVWDRQKHTHWDVQFPTGDRNQRPKYCVISHTGELINDPDGICAPTYRGR